MTVDFGRTAADYAAYRAAYPDRLYDRLAAAGVAPRPGRDAALDLATGTGVIARALAERAWRVTGVDIAPAMVETAAALARAAGASIDFRVAPAEETGCAPQSIDLVTAFCCWHWFDRTRAAAEAHRILRNGGWLVVGAMDFFWEPGNVVDVSGALIKWHNPAWKTDQLGFRMAWAEELPPDRYAILDRLDEPLQISYTQDGWRGRIRASAGVSASMAPEIIPDFDREHKRLLRETYGEDDLTVPHRLYMVIARAL